MPQTEYDRYVRDEWTRFVQNPGYSRFILEAVRGLGARRVLDVGCGAGQMLTPFLDTPGTFGVGVDISDEAGRAGRELIKARHPKGHVCFVRAGAEALPYGPETFDVVICRLALPYTNNAIALTEMARVLRPGGRLLLRIHHWRYYVGELRQALKSRQARVAVHDLRVLAAGSAYYLTGRQPRNRLLGTECFQTRGLLRRELSRSGLAVKGEMGDSTTETPSFIIVKREDAT